MHSSKLNLNRRDVDLIKEVGTNLCKSILHNKGMTGFTHKYLSLGSDYSRELKSMTQFTRRYHHSSVITREHY